MPGIPLFGRPWVRRGRARRAAGRTARPRVRARRPSHNSATFHLCGNRFGVPLIDGLSPSRGLLDGVEIKFRAPHAIDAISMSHGNSLVDFHTEWYLWLRNSKRSPFSNGC